MLIVKFFKVRSRKALLTTHIVDQTSRNFVCYNDLDQSFITQNFKGLSQLYFGFSKGFLFSKDFLNNL